MPLNSRISDIWKYACTQHSTPKTKHKSGKRRQPYCGMVFSLLLYMPASFPLCHISYSSDYSPFRKNQFGPESRNVSIWLSCVRVLLLLLFLVLLICVLSLLILRCVVSTVPHSRIQSNPQYSRDARESNVHTSRTHSRISRIHQHLLHVFERMWSSFCHSQIVRVCRAHPQSIRFPLYLSFIRHHCLGWLRWLAYVSKRINGINNQLMWSLYRLI